MSIWKWSHAGIFVGGMLFATKGVEALAGKAAHKVYVHTTAAVLRGRDQVMNGVTCVREGCEDIYAEAVQLNEEKANAPEVIEELRQRGFSRIVMMTGDNEKTAAFVAGKTGVDEYIAEVLPEDKAEFVRKAKSSGSRVIMIGDGINDSPALSEADAGIAVNTGAAIAREIADVTIEAEDLRELLVLRDISDALMQRIGRDYRVIISFNSMLIALGALGVITPATSAMLHNLSTIGISVYNMTDLIEA